MEHNPKLTKYAQQLRKNMTLEERILWYQYLKDYPLQFRRQVVIGNYIVDFFCHKANLVIELDGSQHYEPEKQEEDRKRTEYLEQKKITVLRFANTEIKNNLSGVCQLIDSFCKQDT